MDGTSSTQPQASSQRGQSEVGGRPSDLTTATVTDLAMPPDSISEKGNAGVNIDSTPPAHQVSSAPTTITGAPPEAISARPRAFAPSPFSSPPPPASLEPAPVSSSPVQATPQPRATTVAATATATAPTSGGNFQANTVDAQEQKHAQTHGQEKKPTQQHLVSAPKTSHGEHEEHDSTRRTRTQGELAAGDPLPQGRIQGTVEKVASSMCKGRNSFGFITHSSRAPEAPTGNTRYYFSSDELVMAEPNAPLYVKVHETVEFAVEERGVEIFAVDITRPGGQGLPSQRVPAGRRFPGTVRCSSKGHVSIVPTDRRFRPMTVALSAFVVAPRSNVEVCSLDGCPVEYSTEHSEKNGLIAVHITQVGGVPLNESCMTSASGSTKRARSPAHSDDERHDRTSSKTDRNPMAPDPRVVAVGDAMKTWIAATNRIVNHHPLSFFQPDTPHLNPPIGGPSVSSLEHQTLAFVRCAVHEISRFCLRSDLSSLMMKRSPEASKDDRCEVFDRLMVRGEVEVWHSQANDKVRIVVPTDWRSTMPSTKDIKIIDRLLQSGFSKMDRHIYGPPHRRYNGPLIQRTRQDGNDHDKASTAIVTTAQDGDRSATDDAQHRGEWAATADPEVVLSGDRFHRWKAIVEGPPPSTHRADGAITPGAPRLEPARRPVIAMMEHETLALSRLALREVSRFARHSSVISAVSRRVAASVSKEDRQEALDRLFARAEMGVFWARSNTNTRIFVPRNWASLVSTEEALRLADCLRKDYITEHDLSLIPSVEELTTRGAPDMKKPRREGESDPKTGTVRGRNEESPTRRRPRRMIDGQDLMLTGEFLPRFGKALSRLEMDHHENGEFTDGCPRLPPSTRIVAKLEHELLLISRTALVVTGRFVRKSDAVLSSLHRTTTTREERMEAFDRLEERKEMLLKRMTPHVASTVLVPRDWRRYVSAKEGRRIDRLIHRDLTRDASPVSCSSSDVSARSRSPRGRTHHDDDTVDEDNTAAFDGDVSNDEDDDAGRGDLPPDPELILQGDHCRRWIDTVASVTPGCFDDADSELGRPHGTPVPFVPPAPHRNVTIVEKELMSLARKAVRTGGRFPRCSDISTLLNCRLPNVATKATRDVAIKRLIDRRDIQQFVWPFSRAGVTFFVPHQWSSEFKSRDEYQMLSTAFGAFRETLKAKGSDEKDTMTTTGVSEATPTKLPTFLLTTQEDKLVMRRAQFNDFAEAELARFPLPNPQHRDPDASIREPHGRRALVPPHRDVVTERARKNCIFFTRKTVRLARKFPRSDDVFNYIASRLNGRYATQTTREVLNTLEQDGVLTCETTQHGGMFLMPTNWSQLSEGDPQLHEAVSVFRRNADARRASASASASTEPTRSMQRDQPSVASAPPPAIASSVLPPPDASPLGPAPRSASVEVATAASGAGAPALPTCVQSDDALPQIPALFKANETPEIVRWRSFWAQVRDRAQWHAAKQYRRTLDSTGLDAAAVARCTAPGAPSIGEMSSILIEGADGSLAGDVEKDVAQLLAYLTSTCAPSVIHNVSVGSRDLASDHGTTGYGVRGLGRAVLLLTAQLGTAAEVERLRAALPAAMRVETAVGEPLATTTMTLRGRALDHIPNDIIESVLEGFGPCRVTCVEDTTAPRVAPVSSPTAIQAPAAFLQIPGAMLGGTGASSVSRGAGKRDRDDGEGEGATESAKEVIVVTFTDPRHGAADCRACLRAVQFHMAAEWQCVASMASVGVERAALNRTAKASAI